MSLQRLLPVEQLGTIRQVRAISIIDAQMELTGEPVGLHQVHVLAYLTDVLSPIWNLPVIDPYLLKQRTAIYYPALQHELDRLIGMGVLTATNLSYDEYEQGHYRLNARYSINHSLAEPALAIIKNFAPAADGYKFVREVVLAASAFDELQIGRMKDSDPTYASTVVAFNDVLSLEQDDGRNPTARIAFEFRTLSDSAASLSSPELIHLYVKALYAGLRVA